MKHNIVTVQKDTAVMNVMTGMLITSTILNRVGIKKNNTPMMVAGVTLYFAAGVLAAGVAISDIVTCFKNKKK